MAVDVRFVVTPFVPNNQPALGVSSLAATLEAVGFKTHVSYLNLNYLSHVGENVYQLLAKFSQVTLLGEVIFARALWGDQACNFEEYWQALLSSLNAQADEIVTGGQWVSIRQEMAEAKEILQHLYQNSPQLIDGWAREIVSAKPKVVGFSSSFQQNVATLALAQAVRLLDPQKTIAIAMGGANCEGEMGQQLAARFAFLDAVVAGESESIIVDLVRRLTQEPVEDIANKDSQKIIKITHKSANDAKFVKGSFIFAMDELAEPKFDDFFTQAKHAGISDKVNLAAETARGCWWGAKAHCKFCGLNGDSMVFRAKGGQRAAAELRSLRETYGTDRIMITDNILDMKYFNSLLPELEGEGFDLFYEIKSNLKRDQVGQLARAGVRWVQPGVESLDSVTLQQIAKGVSAIQNIQLLKWCKEAGVKPFWSILHSFPGETTESLERMTAIIPSLHHLPPPMQLSPFQLHRFSPYHFDAQHYEIEGIRPAWGYRFAYPGLSEEERGRLAYCFEYDEENPITQSSAFAKLSLVAGMWMSTQVNDANLCLIRNAEDVIVYDSRNSGEPPLMESISPLEEQLLNYLSEARGVSRVLEHFSTEPADKLQATIDSLLDQSWLIEMDNRLLSVVLDYSWAAEWRNSADTTSHWM